MNILVLGSGAREHAILSKLIQSKLVDNLFTAPGNYGTSKISKNVNINVNEFQKIKDFSLEKNIDIIIVGPEEPLINGIFDFFENSNISVIGPSKEAAVMESSKCFAKDFMIKYDINTPKYRSFDIYSFDEAIKFVEENNAPFVIKCDGIAAGKGVIITQDKNEAKKEIENILKKDKFGKSGDNIIIEEFIDGIEMSCFIATDGINYQNLPNAKDYKKIGEGEKGLNTGGMGAISPAFFASKKLLHNIEKKIIIPTLNGLKKENILYKGFIFFGITCIQDEPYLFEYNIRLGDPEAQVILPRIKNDFMDIILAIKNNQVDKLKIKENNEIAATVIMASGGYPLNYKKGIPINGLDDLKDDKLIFHAGTIEKNNQVLTNGGRVISFTSTADNPKDAISKSYQKIQKINFQGAYYRKDIGRDIIK